MLERGFSRDDVLAALLSGQQIEDYPDDTSFPSGLCFPNGMRTSRCTL
ncbi:MAG: DUF4258 domain-containing protein [Acidobacteriota bacterium]